MKSTTETLRIKNSWNMSRVHKIGQTESCTNCQEHFYPNKRKLKLKNNWFLDLVFWIAKCKNSSKSCPIFFNQNSPSYLAQSWILIFWLQWYVINYDIHQCIASIFSKSLSSSPPWKGWHSLVSNLPQSSWSKEEYWKINFHYLVC